MVKWLNGCVNSKVYLFVSRKNEIWSIYVEVERPWF